MTNANPEPSFQPAVVPLGINEARSRVGLLGALDPNDQTIQGGVEGPTCEYAKTLKARYRWRKPAIDRAELAAWTDIPESCLWEPEHPFLYSANWQANQVAGTQTFGLRQLALTKSGLRLNGRPFHFRGLKAKSADQERLRLWHTWGCDLAWLAEPDFALLDRFGPFCVADLPEPIGAAESEVWRQSPKHPTIGLWRSQSPRSADEYTVLRQAFGRQLATGAFLFADAIDANEPFPESAADLCLVSGTLEQLCAKAAVLATPWIACLTNPELQVDSAESWRSAEEVGERLVTSHDNCHGWIVLAEGVS